MPEDSPPYAKDSIRLWSLAFRFARRELRGGLQGLRVMIACLFLGVFAIAASGSVRSAVEAGLSVGARSLLGGDLEVRQSLVHPGKEQRQFLAQYGIVSEVREMRAMARSVGTDKIAMVELKAVDNLYPLYGDMGVEPGEPLAALLDTRAGLFGAVADSSLAHRLDIKVGDSFHLGETTLQLRALITEEPDRAASVMAFGPRVIVSPEGWEATRLEMPGSLVRTALRLKTPQPLDAAGVERELEAAFPGSGWRVRGLDAAAPDVRRVLGNVTLFLSLVGLTALLTGGIGVANAVRTFVGARMATIATLRTLGASSALVFRIYMLQVSILALCAVGAAMFAAAAVPAVVGSLLADVFPVALPLGVWPAPLLQAAAAGLLVAAVFGLWPLARCREVPAAALFRGVHMDSSFRPRGLVVPVIVLCALALAMLTILSAERRDVAIGFVLGALVSFGLFRLAATVVIWLASRVVLRGAPLLRLGFANVCRPGAPTVPVVLSLGLGLSVLATVALIEVNLNQQIRERIPDTAPAFYFIDLQTANLDAFRAEVEAVPAARITGMADMARGRIVAVNGQPVDEASVDPEVRWAVRGDRGLTTSAHPPEGSVLVAGAWWPQDYGGEPLVSVAANVARGLGVGVGDSLTFSILGRTMDVRIGSLREINWSTLSLNFAFVFNPRALEGVPRTWIATVYAAPRSEDALERAVVRALPSVSAIRVKEALDSVASILDRASYAIRLAASLAVIAGLLVLSAAISAGHKDRVRDAVILKVLGATRATLLKVWMLEYGVTGVATGVVAAGVGTVAARVVLQDVMRAQWVFMPGVTFAIVCGGLVLVLAGGLASGLLALSGKPAVVLRHE
ncbi:ABC transporter permease [Haematospirillum sp. H1815]|uniref:ABC transporter permease n=1 Tax=Haematospirillum sp. H1815 TaxID=2723108 RepID=UPI00143B3847|nr:FtsX-like permease family protein [Haematospirillum sp. H1815]NKD76951.1 ABC transporter permease [Haematospirillum sp. H1815]